MVPFCPQLEANKNTIRVSRPRVAPLPGDWGGGHWPQSAPGLPSGMADSRKRFFNTPLRWSVSVTLEIALFLHSASNMLLPLNVYKYVNLSCELLFGGQVFTQQNFVSILVFINHELMGVWHLDKRVLFWELLMWMEIPISMTVFVLVTTVTMIWGTSPCSRLPPSRGGTEMFTNSRTSSGSWPRWRGERTRRPSAK